MAAALEEGVDESKTESKGDKKPRFLSREDLINGKWLYCGNGGWTGEMQFKENNTIGIYNHENERSWKLQSVAYGYTILELYKQDGSKGAIFMIQTLDANGYWRLTAPNWSTYLIQVR